MVCDTGNTEDDLPKLRKDATHLSDICGSKVASIVRLFLCVCFDRKVAHYSSVFLRVSTVAC